jgi:hypothetical protein
VPAELPIGRASNEGDDALRAPIRRVGVAVALATSLGFGLLAGGSGATAAVPPGTGNLSLADVLQAPLVPIGQAAVPLAGSHQLGALPSGRVLQLGIALSPRDPAALASYAAAVNTPGSPSFGHFITPAEFRSRFGPTAGAISAVTAVLRSEGFSVRTPSENGLIMPVAAPVGVVERVLGVTMRAYRLGGGAPGWAATTAPKLQAPIADDVTAILGLDELVGPHNFMLRKHSTAAQATPATTASAQSSSAQSSSAQSGGNGGPVACSAAARGASSNGGWTFNQIASAYGVNGLYNDDARGQGETVAIFELEPFARSDIDTFDTCYFGASGAASMLNRLSVVQVDGGIPVGAGSGEAVLDVEDVSALAPDASIEVYEAPSSSIGTQYATNDIYNAMVNNDTANVISTSWGLCEPAFEVASPGAQEVENSIFEEAAAQGQSVFAAAGDSGSNDCAYGSTPTSPAVSVDDPASQPFVVGVGGTSLHSASQPPVENVWNDGGFGGGGGGGISSTWPSAGWQADSGVAGVSNSYSASPAYAFCEPAGGLRGGSLSTPPCREVPDVTIDADEDTGTSIYQASGGGWGTIGGTSTAAPMWAAITTDIASSDSCSGLALNSRNHERDLGFVAPALYEAAATSSPGEDFNDITSGSNDIFGLGKGYPATAGYDLASGLGSPVVTAPAAARRSQSGTDTGLSASLCQLLTPSGTRPSVTGLSPAHGAVTGGNTVVVKGTGFSGSGVTVEAVTFGSAGSSFSVTPDGTISAVAPPAPPQAGTGGEERGTPGPVNVTVTIDTAAGVTTTPPTATTSRYIYTAGSSQSPLPSVSGIGPSGGPTAGGNVVDLYGSGFGTAAPIASVSFGGVRAAHWTYVSNYELVVTVPTETKATRCTTGTGFVPTNTCQVQVVVTGHNGASPTATILPPYFGNMTANDEGIVVPPKGTEIDPAPSEYDYAPTARITSVTPQPYSESSFKPVAVHGSGFNVLTLNWVNIGLRSNANNNYSAFITLTATEITVTPVLPGAGSGTKILPGGVSVLGLGGLSNAVAFRYTK